jgi:hypothetical protein
MLHLFDKVYLEIDDKIDINLDRAVISNTHGLKMAEALERHSSGVVIYYTTDGTTVDYAQLFKDIKLHTDTSGKRFFIYCDSENFIRIAATWLKTYTNISKANFETIINCHVHKERVGQGRNWVSEDLLYVASIKNHIDLFDSTPAFNPAVLDIDLSFELYLAAYLADNTNSLAVTKLRKQMSMFLRRIYEEIFVDIKSMLLLNILSPTLQTVMGGSGKTLSNYSELPKISIFLDTTIWNDSKPLVVGSACSFNWDVLTSTKATILGNTISEIHTDFEGFVHDSTNLSHWNFLQYVVGKDLTSSELSEVIDSIIATPSDNFFIPKTDITNVNYVFCTHLSNLKRDNNLSMLTAFALK